MSPDPQPDAQQSSADRAESDRLPFEPAKNRKKPEKKAPTAPVKSQKQSDSKKSDSKKPDSKSLTVKNNRPEQSARAGMSIPDAVSRRMVQRMALFCGIPSALGVFTFFVSYFVVINNLVLLPNVAVVLVSMGFFGLGVLGLSYGVLSASWDEEAVGSPLGWSEFTTNLGRMTEAWRSPGNKS